MDNNYNTNYDENNDNSSKIMMMFMMIMTLINDYLKTIKTFALVAHVTNVSLAAAVINNAEKENSNQIYVSYPDITWKNDSAKNDESNE